LEPFSGYDENPNNFLPGENRNLVLVSLVEYGKKPTPRKGVGRLRMRVEWRSKGGGRVIKEKEGQKMK
jgi:hypothetical protein